MPAHQHLRQRQVSRCSSSASASVSMHHHSSTTMPPPPPAPPRAKPRMQSVLTEKLAEVRSDLMKLPLLLAADPHSDLLRMIEELSSNIQDQVGRGQVPLGSQHLHHPWLLVQCDGSWQCLPVLDRVHTTSQQGAMPVCRSGMQHLSSCAAAITHLSPVHLLPSGARQGQQQVLLPAHPGAL